MAIFTDFFNLHSKLRDALRAQQDFDDLQAEMSGILNGRQARFLKSGQDTDGDRSKRRLAQERRDIEQFYLALMREQQFGGYIASEIFDGKSNWEILDIIALIETKTGLSFEDYAANILGAEAVERLPDETDESYNRRILKLLTEEMLEADGSIKPQYADDPLADIIRNDAAYQRIMDDVKHINLHGPSEEADRIVAEHKEAGYAAAEASADHIVHDEYKSELRDGQDGHGDTKTDEKAVADDNLDFLADISSPPTGTKPF